MVNIRVLVIEIKLYPPPGPSCNKWQLACTSDVCESSQLELVPRVSLPAGILVSEPVGLNQGITAKV